jgi:hypothetical protein
MDAASTSEMLVSSTILHSTTSQNSHFQKCSIGLAIHVQMREMRNTYRLLRVTIQTGIWRCPINMKMDVTN